MLLCLEHLQNSDTGSMTQRSSPVTGNAAEQLSGSSNCSSPDDNSCDGVKLEEAEAWHLRLAYSTIWPGMVIAVCPYLDRYFLASAGNSVSHEIFICSQPQFTLYTVVWKLLKRDSLFFPSFMCVDFQMITLKG